MELALFIPARINSQRLPRKMLCEIGNQPLIAHVVDRAIESGIAEIVVATDSDEIASVVQGKGAHCVMTSEAHQSGSDRVYEAVMAIDPSGKRFEAVINLQGDMPFISSDMITYLAERIKAADSDIATLVSPIEANSAKIHNPSFVKAVMAFADETETFGRAVYFSRQPVPYNAATFYEHIGIYAYKRAALEKFVKNPPSSLEKQEKLEQLRAYSLGMNIEAYLVSNPPTSVDTPEDLERAKSDYMAQFCRV